MSELDNILSGQGVLSDEEGDNENNNNNGNRKGAPQSPQNSQQLQVNQHPQIPSQNAFFQQTQAQQQHQKKFASQGLKVEDYYTPYDKLQSYIDEFNNQIGNLLKKSEDDFLHAYKEQMTKIQQELKTLKRKIDEETKKQKANDKMNILEEERDYFRAEALRLDKICKDQLRDIEELKFKMKILTEDKNYYEGFVIETKKENKALKSELLYLYKNKVDEKQKFEANQNINQNFMEQEDEEREEQYQHIPQEQQYQKNEQLQIQTNQFQEPNFQIKPNSPQLESEKNFYMTQPEFNQFNNVKNNGRAISHQILQRPNKKVEIQSSELDILKANEKKYLETIKHLRQYLEREKINNKKLVSEITQYNVQRSELEEILLSCINEARKDISRRRVQQKESAIMNLKQSNVQLQNFKPFIEEEDVEFNKFSHSDKVNLLKKYISSEQFLKQIYTITFDNNNNNQASIQGGPPRTASTSTRPQTQQTHFGMISGKRLQQSWKQDYTEASNLYNNKFKGFRYTFSAKNLGRQNASKKDLSTTSYKFSNLTQEKINKIKNS